MSELMAVAVLTVALFVALPAVVLHYMTKWRAAGGLKPDDEHMLEDLWRSARKMERRIEVLEQILDTEAPGWRRRHDREEE